MPRCFALYPKGGTEKISLQDVDKELCEFFGVKVSETEWLGNWYNTIGLSLAIGHDWGKIREFFPEMKNIIDFMEENYTPDSWKEWK
jgi:hypothetical protein